MYYVQGYREIHNVFQVTLGVCVDIFMSACVYRKKERGGEGRREEERRRNERRGRGGERWGEKGRRGDSRQHQRPINSHE